MAKKKEAIKKSKVQRKSSVVLLLFILVGILLLGLTGLILVELGIFERSDSPDFFSVRDECGSIMGNLIHQIRDEGECRIKCVNECDVRGMEFSSFDFELRNNDCNVCGCWCD